MTRARSLSKLSNPATFTVDTDNNIGVNSISPVEKLNIVGVVSATSFFGDGSSLTGVSASGLSGTPDLSIRNLTGVAATFTGVVTYEDVTNVDSVGVVTARSGLRVVGGGLTVTGVSTFFDAVKVNNDMTFDGSGNNLRLNDNSVLEFGTGNDLNIFHNSSVSVIRDGGAGGLLIDSDNEIKLAKNGTGNDSMAVFTVDGSAELYYDGAKKIETTTDGVVITGIVTATSFSGDGSGLSGVGGQLDVTSSLFI